MPKGLPYGAIRHSLAAAPEVNKTRHSTYSGVPRREILAMLVGLVRSQGPGHEPQYEKLPEFAARWFRKYDDEPSVAARWYSAGPTNAGLSADPHPMPRGRSPGNLCGPP